MRTMLKLMLLLVALGLASQVRAQDPVATVVTPVFEGGVGYIYMKASVPSEGSMWMKGIQASATKDLNAHFGIKLEVGYSRSFDAFQTGLKADIFTYMGGPVFVPVRRRKFSIYVEALAGGARETGVNFKTDGTLIRGFVNHPAYAGGVGFQYRISPGLSIRPGVEYLRTAFFDSNVAIKSQFNLQSSVSLMYTFGQRQ